MTSRIVSARTFLYLVQLLLVFRVEGNGVVQNNAEEIAARRARDLLQSMTGVPAAPAPGLDAPDRTWLALTECHDHCRQCDRYGNCGACKEGYIPIQKDTGLECACVDNDCFSCPEDPGECAVCRDVTSEPDSAGKCICRQGFVYDDASGTCLKREEVVWEEPAQEPVPELAPEPVPELAPEPVPELAPEPVSETVPTTPVTPITLIRPTNPNLNVGDPICQDSLCSLCPEGASTCQQCANNASADKNGVCVCDDGFEQMMGISGSSGCLAVPSLGDPACMDGLCSLCPVWTEPCQQCTSNASMGENGVCGCDAGFLEMTSLNGFGCMQIRNEGERPLAPTPPTKPSNGISIGPKTGFSAGDSGRVSVTPLVEDKIQALADKVRAATHFFDIDPRLSLTLSIALPIARQFGIVLGDKYRSVVEKKKQASESIADTIATTAPAVAEIAGSRGEATVNSVGDGFQYTNIRLESVIPDDFYEPDPPNVLSQEAAYAYGLSSDGGASGSTKLRDWLANKFNKDDELSNLPAAAPYLSGIVSGYNGAPEQPATPLTPEESFREDLMNKKDLLTGLLKETDDAMRQRVEERRGGADETTRALLDMLKDVDNELERRIT